MKEMTHPGHNRNRKCLRPRPVHHIGKQHRVILLAMDNQRPAMRCSIDGRRRCAADASADEHQFFNSPQGVEATESMCDDKSTE